jgi:hypothetical protein
MKTFKFFSLLIISLVFNQSCADHQTTEEVKLYNFGAFDETEKSKPFYNVYQYNNTKGYWENGEIITNFYCPDAKSGFPPIDIKSWDKTPAVNGRFPTYEETMNGTAIHHYGEKENSLVKPYNMTLPRLARYIGSSSITINGPMKNELVVVIQIVQTAQDTIVGYRFLTGGVGGSAFRDYHFLTQKEVEKVVAQ